MVAMRDGVRLNTFVFLPDDGRRSYPVIMQRSPYGITSPAGEAIRDPTRGWLPDPARPFLGPLLRGWRRLVEHGYAAVYQDCRGRFGSEGIDRVYGDDADDGYDTLEWIASQEWSDGNVGLSGSSAAGTTAMAAASRRHPSVRAFFAQVGGSSIYDDVVYEGQSVEIERLWLWVANNIPALSASHRAEVIRRAGLGPGDFAKLSASARGRYLALSEAQKSDPPFVDSPDWMRLPLTGYPDFSVAQPYLDEIITHPAPDEFRARHNFRSTIDVPGFHVTSWYDIFLVGVITAFQEIQERVGNQRLWIGPNTHHFVYETQFWPGDPYFRWFDHWLRDRSTPLAAGPAVFYSPRAWVPDAAGYVADDWRGAATWPPPRTRRVRWHLHGDGTLGHVAGGPARSYPYDPRRPIPSRGGRGMLIPGGMLDQRPVQALPHYGLIYRSDVLGTELTVAGEVTVTLSVESDCPDTDFVAKVIELRPDGSAMLVMDGVARAMYRDGGPQARLLTNGEIVEVSMSLGHIHHTFAAGSRLEVDVTSSDFPRRIRNTNSGHPVLAADSDHDIRVATNTVHHAPEHPSFVELSILDADRTDRSAPTHPTHPTQ
jgi:hypothetical protein